MTEVGCWQCLRAPEAAEIEFGVVLRPRSARSGGPLLLFRCPACSVENLVERNAAGEILLSPPEAAGHHPKDQDEERRYAARRWLAGNAEIWREFLARPAPPGKRNAPWPAAMPRARPVPAAESIPEPTPEPPHREETRVDTSEVVSLIGAYELLDLPLNAPPQDIRDRYRELAKSCHPDRVAGLDPEIRDLADRKFRALRRAYELITGSE